MVEFYERPLAKTIKLDAYNALRSIEIPRDRFIQEIILRLKGTYDTSATAPTLAEDQPYSIMKMIRLVANGNDILRAIAGYSLSCLNWFDFCGTELEKIGIAATASLADAAWSFALHLPFKVDIYNPFDVSALLPAKNFSSLDLFIQWGANTDLATANAPTDIENKTEVEVAIREAYVTDEEAQRLWGRNWENLIKNYILEVTKTVDAAYTEFKFEHDLPTGMIIRRSLLINRLNALRSNTLMPKFKVAQESPVKRDIIEREWYKSQIQDKAEYLTGAARDAGEITIKGATIIDFETLPCINATGLKKGDIKLKASTASPTGTTNMTLVTEEFI